MIEMKFITSVSYSLWSFSYYGVWDWSILCLLLITCITLNCCFWCLFYPISRTLQKKTELLFLMSKFDIHGRSVLFSSLPSCCPHASPLFFITIASVNLRLLVNLFSHGNPWLCCSVYDCNVGRCQWFGEEKMLKFHVLSKWCTCVQELGHNSQQSAGRAVWNCSPMSFVWSKIGNCASSLTKIWQ